MEFILSTSWNAFRCDSSQRMIFEIKELGFEAVELSFNLSATMVEELERLVRAGKVRVASVHNFCPVPDGLNRQVALPDHYSMASCDEEERALALKFSKQSIDTAKRLNARAVVLHCGRVEVVDHTKDLIRLYQQGKKESAEFSRLHQEMIRERSQLCPPFFQNTLKSLEELAAYAEKSGISLGIENRIYHREIPSLEEIGVILKHFKDGPVFYWHDTGHARVMENLGFCRQQEFLDAYSGLMLGIHLHDVLGCSDHQAPGKGELDFRAITPYLKNPTLKVIEAHSQASSDDVKSARNYLEGILNAPA